MQQFTGCPSTTTMPSPSLYKEPITLNFQQGSKRQIQHDTTRTVPQFSTRINNQAHQQVPQHQQQLLLQEEQQRGYSRPSMDVSGGLLVDHDFGLHDLTVNAFSNDAF